MGACFWYWNSYYNSCGSLNLYISFEDVEAAIENGDFIGDFSELIQTSES